jgi:hypothetical protein
MAKGMRRARLRTLPRTVALCLSRSPARPPVGACTGLTTNLSRQYRRYPIGKNRLMHEARETDCGQELRLIFGRVRPRQLPADGSRLPMPTVPIRLVGLLATDKDQRRLRDNVGRAAWDRLQQWLGTHDRYELDGAG